MSKSKVILSIIAVLLVIGLFLLPKVVVDNTETSDVTGTPEASSGTSVASSNGSEPPKSSEAHNSEVSAQDQALINTLRENIEISGDNEKNAIFADSLAVVFKSNNKLDSAAKYLAIAAENSPSKERLIAAGNSYYEAFTFAVDPEKSQSLAEKARNFYSKAMPLSSKEEVLDIQAKEAMTYIASANPMKGISMLTDIVKEDPEHEQALFNLGILSIQSGQYDKAVGRFEKLVQLYPENLQAQFYLGLSYHEAGMEDEAKKQFEKVKKLDKDPEVHAAVDAYLEEIQ